MEVVKAVPQAELVGSPYPKGAHLEQMHEDSWRCCMQPCSTLLISWQQWRGPCCLVDER